MSSPTDQADREIIFCELRVTGNTTEHPVEGHDNDCPTMVTSLSMPANLFIDETPGHPAVRGYFHEAASSNPFGLVLTHGAGSNCNSPLLVGLAEALCAKGISVLRCDLPFRQKRPHGPPLGTAEQDQAGLDHAVHVLRNRIGGRVFLGGHSYGGRMASMLAAQQQSLAGGLLLLSYPLHPPRKPEQLRTGHFPKLNTRVLFAHGTRDPFGSIDEMQASLQRIPAHKKLVSIENAGHELVTKSDRAAVVEKIVMEFEEFFL